MLPRFTEVSRQRPVALLAPDRVVIDVTPTGEVDRPAGAVAPYLAVVADLRPGTTSARVGWAGPGLSVDARLDGGRVGLRLVAGGRTRDHVSRRHGRTEAPTGLAVSLTGRQVTAYVREDSRWVPRARVDLPPEVHPHDEQWLDRLRVRAAGDPDRVQAGTFGQLGLRDLHVATYADGEPVWRGRELVLSATHAGPGRFATARTGVWTLHADTLVMTHRADLYVRREPTGGGPPGVYGDHATHLVRDGDRWLVATSTWGDFDGTDVRLVLGTTEADLLAGVHVLDVTPLTVPMAAAGVWDPHLLRRDGEWWLALTAARRFFDFRPALCRGPALDALRLVGSDETRRATEGTVMARIDEQWCVLASDGRDNPRGRRAAYGVYDLAMRRIGELDAPYPTNIPWPMVVRDGGAWLMITFDGTPYGDGPGDQAGDRGRRGVLDSVLDPGSHGDVVVMRSG